MTTRGQNKKKVRQESGTYSMDLEAKLHRAVTSKNLPWVQDLIDWKVNVNTLNAKKNTPLHMASYFGCVEIAKILLDNGASVDARTLEGQTALHFASQKGHLEIVKLIIAKGAEIDEKQENKEGKTPLLIAAKFGNTEIVTFLLENAANVDATDVKEWTALHYAAFYGHHEIANVLINYEAKVNDIESGFAPIHFAVNQGHKKLVEILIKNGANLRLKNSNRETPLGVALRNGNQEIANFINSSKDASHKISDKISVMFKPLKRSMTFAK